MAAPLQRLSNGHIGREPVCRVTVYACFATAEGLMEAETCFSPLGHEDRTQGIQPLMSCWDGITLSCDEPLVAETTVKEHVIITLVCVSNHISAR